MRSARPFDRWVRLGDRSMNEMIKLLDVIVHTENHQSRCANGDMLAHDILSMANEIEQLKLAEEGAKEAFDVVAQSKHDLKEECNRLRKLLDSAHDQIRRLTCSS